MSGCESVLCFITDRKLASVDLEGRAEKITAAGAQYMMLREKDLPENELVKLSLILADIAVRHRRRFIVNSNLKAALASGAWGLHLPFSALEKHGFDLREIKRCGSFKIGVSVHSLEEGREAVRAGADLLLAGNIFESSCKEGSPGRGLNFLRALTKLMNIPVWAVGGISPANIGQVLSAGAEVACVRSPLMLSVRPDVLTKKYLAAGTFLR